MWCRIISDLSVIEQIECRVGNSNRMHVLQVAEKVAAAEKQEALREQQRVERAQQREAERLQRQKEREEKRARDTERDDKTTRRRKVINTLWLVDTYWAFCRVSFCYNIDRNKRNWLTFPQLLLSLLHLAFLVKYWGLHKQTINKYNDSVAHVDVSVTIA